MNQQSYDIFWQRMHKRAKDNGLLWRVMFELTYRCNFKCNHCYIPASYRKRYRRELTTKEVFSILDQLAEIGCFYLGFTGGEPFLRKDFFSILRYARKKCFQVIIYSNGYLLDEKMLKALKEISPNKIDITIPAMSKKAFESITGIKGARDRVFKNIRFLHKKGIKLGFKSCILKENEREIKNIESFAESLGARHRKDSLLMARLDGDRAPFDYRPAIKENVQAQLSSKCANDELFSSGMEEPPELFKCGCGISQAAITPGGELKLCLMIDYPKYKILNTQSAKRGSGLENRWTQLKDFVLKIKPDGDYVCHKCGVKNYCNWCPAKSWLYNKTFTSCDPRSAQWAQAVKGRV